MRREQRLETLCQTVIEHRVNRRSCNPYHGDVTNSSSAEHVPPLLPEEEVLVAETFSRSLSIAARLLSPKSLMHYHDFLRAISPMFDTYDAEWPETEGERGTVDYIWSPFWSTRERQLSSLSPDHGVPSKRKQWGAYYTPRAFVEQIVEATMARVTPCSDHAPHILDPTCGTGNFLVSAYEYQRRHRASLDEIIHGLFGIDTDPVALAIAQARIGLLHLAHGGNQVDVLRRHLVVGDALTQLTEHTKGGDDPSHFFDVVVGNPPFLNRVRGEVLRDVQLRNQVDMALEGALHPYTDISAVFLALATNVIREGGAVGMCQPSSIVAGRDSAAVRDRIVSTATLEELLIAKGRTFDAGTSVVAPILRIREKGQGPGSSNWSSHVAKHFKIPTCSMEQLAWSGQLGELADITADFRDQYYWVCERLDQPPTARTCTARVLTSGHIGSGFTRWHEKSVRIGGQQRLRPVLAFDPPAESPPIARWLNARLQRKLLVATQTKTLECAVDLEGDLLPLTPVVSITPHEISQVFHLQAVLLSPTITSLVCTMTLGTGLSLRALKLSARELRALPLPADHSYWDAAATIHEQLHTEQAIGATRRQALLTEAAHLMALAYQHPINGLDWWASALDL